LLKWKGRELWSVSGRQSVSLTLGRLYLSVAPRFAPFVMEGGKEGRREKGMLMDGWRKGKGRMGGTFVHTGRKKEGQQQILKECNVSACVCVTCIIYVCVCPFMCGAERRNKRETENKNVNNKKNNNNDDNGTNKSTANAQKEGKEERKKRQNRQRQEPTTTSKATIHRSLLPSLLVSLLSTSCCCCCCVVFFFSRLAVSLQFASCFI
jgi:hypothetical protein